MQIYEILKKDHEVVKGLLTELIALSDEANDERIKLVEKIRDELIPHARAEEAVFYNAIRALDVDAGKVMHGYKEHMEAEALLRLLQVKDKVNLDWKSTAKELKKALLHHIKEEEGAIFTLGKKVLSDEEAVKIGKAFKALKPEIKDQGIMGTTLDMVKNLMPPKLTKIFDPTSLNP